MFDLLSRLPAIPAVCEVCARWPSESVCVDCQTRHGRWLPRCRGCALPLAPGLDLCIRCTESRTGALQELAARVDYSHPWVSLVARLKTDPSWAMPLARLIWQAPEAVHLAQQCDLMLPIPLSPHKLALRGFNQAWELTRALRRMSPHSMITRHDLLLRGQSAEDQHRLSRSERLDNVRGAFRVPESRRKDLQNQRVLLIDDVATTGATLQAAAEVLMQEGAREVRALVFARTPAPTWHE